MATGVTVIGLPQAIVKVAKLAIAAQLGSKAGERVLSEGIAERARAKVPVLTGETQASIQVNDEGVSAGSAALYIEFGTSDTPMVPFMRPAADEAGTDVPEVARTLQSFIVGVV